MPQITYKKGESYGNLDGLISLGNSDPNTMGRIAKYEYPNRANLLFDKVTANGSLRYRLSEIFDIQQKISIEELVVEVK